MDSSNIADILISFVKLWCGGQFTCLVYQVMDGI